MGKILIFDIDDTLIMHTRQKNDYYNLNNNDIINNLLNNINYDKIYIYTNGTYGHGKKVIDNLNIKVEGVFGRDTIPYMKPHPGSFNFVNNIVNNNRDECIFFDDLLENLDTAKSIGWKTVWITPNFNVSKPENVDYIFPNIYQALLYFCLKE